MGGRFFQSLHLYIPDREENRTIFTVVPDEQVPLVERVLTAPALAEGLTPEELVELAVSRAVDLLAGGLPESLGAAALKVCAKKIRDNTTGKRVLPHKEEGHGTGRTAVSPFC